VAVRLSDGSVRNAYTVKLLNKSSVPHVYTLKVSGVDVQMAIIGNEGMAPIKGGPRRLPGGAGHLDEDRIRATRCRVHGQR